MRIVVNRIVSDNEATLSTVTVDGKFMCFGLEDEYRVNKVPGETRIPSGIYDVRLREFGGFNNRYSASFPSMHIGMLEVMNVPSFTDILIHIGNYERDTAGCLLVGMGATTYGDICIQTSRIAYKKLYTAVCHAAEQEMLTIEYIDSDNVKVGG